MPIVTLRIEVSARAQKPEIAACIRRAARLAVKYADQPAAGPDRTWNLYAGHPAHRVVAGTIRLDTEGTL